MAGVNCIASTEGEVALAAATAKTVLRIKAAANHRVKVKGWGVFFDGVSATAEPVQVRIIRSSTDGTYTSVTPKKQDEDVVETVQTAAGKNATVEGTAGDEVDSCEVHPQQGYEKLYPPGDEIMVIGGGRLGIEITAPAIVNVRAKFIFEE